MKIQYHPSNSRHIQAATICCTRHLGASYQGVHSVWCVYGHCNLTSHFTGLNLSDYQTCSSFLIAHSLRSLPLQKKAPTGLSKLYHDELWHMWQLIPTQETEPTPWIWPGRSQKASPSPQSEYQIMMTVSFNHNPDFFQMPTQSVCESWKKERTEVEKQINHPYLSCRYGEGYS